MITKEHVERQMKQARQDPELQGIDFDCACFPGTDIPEIGVKAGDVILYSTEAWWGEGDLVALNIEGKISFDTFSKSMRYKVKTLSINPETGKKEVLEDYTDDVFGVVVGMRINGLWKRCDGRRTS